MITNEQVEAALKAWYDAGDAGNFASMFAALKAADLASCARIAELELKVASMIQPYDFYDDRIAELEAALKPFADLAQYYDDCAGEYLFHVRIKPNDLRAAAAALKETGSE